MYSKVVVFFAVVCVASCIPLKQAFVDAADPPMACMATNINISIFDNGKSVMNYSAVLSVRPATGSALTSVSITDMNVASIDRRIYNIANGQFPTVTVDQADPQSCSGTCQFNVKNSTFVISFPFLIRGTASNQTLTYNVIDEGAISSGSGSLLASGKGCQMFTMETSEFDGVRFESNQCCIKTVPVKVATTTPPMCVKYNASVVFYRNANKFANIFADLTYSADKNMFTSSVMDSGSDFIDYFSFSENSFAGNCQGPAGTQQHCVTYVSKGDYKALFQLTVSTSIPKKGLYTTTLGRVISRNSVSLQEEGLAFTPQNPCSYSGNQFDNYAVTSTSQFCCDQFSS